MLRSLVVVVVLVLVRVAGAEPSVQELITKLSDPSAEVRQRAAQQLGYKTKEPARFDALEKAATSDTDPTVRVRALEGLSPQYLDIGKAARWKTLRLKLMKSDADPKVRYLAASQLRPAEPDTYAAHLAVLKSDKDPGVRTIVILSLQDTYAPGLVDAIIPMIQDKDIQRTVISTLGFSKDAKAVAPLLEAVKREQPGAAGALANTQDPKAVDALLALLDKTTNVDIREEVIESIADVPDGRFVAPLLAIWNKLGKADKKLSTKEPEGMEILRDLPHSITAALQAIAEAAPEPCEAVKTATGETKTYLKKIVPKKCGGGARIMEVEKLVAGQLVHGAKLDAIYTADAWFSLAGATDEPSVARDRIAAVLDGATRMGPPRLGISADDKSAWVAMVVKVKDVEWRVSELAINTASGWRIAGGLASIGKDNKAVNAAAKASKLKLAALPDAKSDAALASTFAAFIKAPLDAAAASREELIAFGSGPGERTTSGGVLARAWKAAWAKRITVEGPVVTRLAPSGTSGFVIANILLEKPGKPAYKVPFRILVSFDKAGASWSLVHAHFATAAP